MISILLLICLADLILLCTRFYGATSLRFTDVFFTVLGVDVTPKRMILFAITLVAVAWFCDYARRHPEVGPAGKKKKQKVLGDTSGKNKVIINENDIAYTILWATNDDGYVDSGEVYKGTKEKAPFVRAATSEEIIKHCYLPQLQMYPPSAMGSVWQKLNEDLDNYQINYKRESATAASSGDWARLEVAVKYLSKQIILLYRKAAFYLRADDTQRYRETIKQLYSVTEQLNDTKAHFDV